MESDIYSLTFPKEEDLGIKIIRILHSVIFWGICLIIVALCWIISPLIALLTRNKIFIYQMWAKIWGKVLIHAAANKIYVEGLENIPENGSIIYMPNHQSNLDWMILLAILPLPFRFVIKKELFKIFFFRKIIKEVGYFSLDREAKKHAYNTLMDVISTINKNESIVIFPEGTRTYDGSLGEFKRGSFLLAFKTGIPIIPIAISGSFEIMPRGTFLINPGTIRVSIGKQVTFDEFKEINKENYKRAIEKVRNTISSMLSDLNV